MPLDTRTTLLAALAAGLIAGLVFFAAQLATTGPLIQQAERFERAEPAHGGGHHVHAWEPADGAERTAYTLAADELIGIGYAFLLVGAIGFSGRAVTPASGLAWGAAGFLVFAAAPALGLPPEPPGAVAAGLLARQAWWIGTAAATACGLWALALGRFPYRKLLGVALLALPHLIGAPKAVPGPEAPEQAALAIRFAWASLACNALLWAALGLAVGWLLPRLAQRRHLTGAPSTAV